MPGPTLEHRTGLDALAAVTELLQRTRLAHPTDGSYEAADLQWWWRSPRSTDETPQLFWFDDDGRPMAAAILIDWGDETAFEAMVLPDATDDWIEHVIDAGMAHAAALGRNTLEIEIGQNERVRLDAFARHGFVRNSNGLVETWLAAADRPTVSTLHDGYRLERRSENLARPHHLVLRSETETTVRLEQTSLYRRDLDLLVVDEHDAVAAYGLFWFDPVTSTGMVEPMRTEEAHQRRGLARHVLTSGIDLLAEAGAERIKICFHVDNPAAGDLYLDVGFQPVRQTDILVRTP